MLVHTVFFWLTPDADRTVFERGLNSLIAIQSVSHGFFGQQADTPERPVTDKSFDYGLTIICDSLESHDAYQVDPIHLHFVDTYAHLWTKVLVYDYQ
ncbi:MAG: Dabb family protein [Bacteroidota bacterium]